MVDGYLKILVLKMLAEKDMTGYELMSGVESMQGKRPSPGSMYPLLFYLLGKGMIERKDEKNHDNEKSSKHEKKQNHCNCVSKIFERRKKIYSITEKGRDELKSLISEKKILLRSNIDTVKLFAGNAALKKSESTKELLKLLDTESDILVKNLDLWSDLKKSIITLLKNKNYTGNEEEFRMILTETIAKINCLKKKKITQGSKNKKK